jgi:hypothetical protein
MMVAIVNEKSFLSNISFPVERVPVFGLFGEEPVDTYHDSIVRTDLEQAQSLSVVSRKYCLVEHKDAFDRFLSAVDVLGDRNLTEYDIYNEGSKVQAKWEFPNHQIDVDGDKINLQLVVRNSYDRTSAFSVLFGAYRLICSNGMVIGKSLSKNRQIHIGMIDINNFGKEILNQAEIHTGTGTDYIKRLQDKAVKDADSVFAKIASVSKIPAVHIEAAKAIYLNPAYEADKERNMWSVYNAFTQHLTHDVKNSMAAVDMTSRVSQSIYHMAA